MLDPRYPFVFVGGRRSFLNLPDEYRKIGQFGLLRFGLDVLIPDDPEAFREEEGNQLKRHIRGTDRSRPDKIPREVGIASDPARTMLLESVCLEFHFCGQDLFIRPLVERGVVQQIIDDGLEVRGILNVGIVVQADSPYRWDATAEKELFR